MLQVQLYGRRWTLLGITFLAVLGMGMVLYATVHGVGTSPDSVVYIGIARNLAEGRGLTEPFGAQVDTVMTRFPPLYPGLLAAVGVATNDTVAAARWLNALAFGAIILFVGVALYLTLPGSTWLPIIGSMLVLTATPLLAMHAMAWSEPLFLLLSFLGLFLLAGCLDEIGWWLCVPGAVMIGLGMLVRYAGIAFLATGLLGIVLFSRRPAGKRLVHLIAFGAVGFLPSLLWTMRNLALAGTAAGRSVAFHPVNTSHAWQALYTVSGWLQVPNSAPDAIRLSLMLLVALIVVVAGLIIFRRRSSSEEIGWQTPSFVKLLLLLIVVYSAFLVVSISLLDANTPLDDRILAPVYVAAIFLTIYGVDLLLRTVANPWPWRIGLLATLVLFVGLSVIKDTGWMRTSHHQGLGFSSLAWQRSETIQQVRLLPQDVLIYSNAPEAIYLHTGRRGLPLPKKTKAATRQVNQRYSAELAQLAEQVQKAGAVVVYFRNLQQQNLPSEAELRQQRSLSLQAYTTDGAVYGAAAIR